jgi:ATP-dependent Clp protease ATP-binding subunit ClpC
MFEKFNDAARRAVAASAEKAREMNAAEIDTGHLLLGLLHFPAGQPNNAGELLTLLGVPVLAVHDATLAAMPSGKNHPASPGHIPFTLPLKKSLELSLRGSFILGDNFVGSAHLLYGLARNTDSTAGRVLAGLGVTFEKIHDAVKGVIHATAPTAERLVEVYVPVGKSIFKNGGKIYPDVATATSAHPDQEIAPFTVSLAEGEFFDLVLGHNANKSVGSFADYSDAFAAAESFREVQGVTPTIRILTPEVQELRGKDSRGHDVVLGRSVEYARVSVMSRIAETAG